MFKIDNKVYAIDMNKLMKWVATTPSSEKNVSTTITQVIPIIDEETGIEEETMANFSTKEITENKETLNDTMNSIRYDIVKIFLNKLLENEFYEGSLENNLTYQQRICFNTLLHNGIIIELNAE